MECIHIRIRKMFCRCNRILTMSMQRVQRLLNIIAKLVREHLLCALVSYTIFPIIMRKVILKGRIRWVEVRGRRDRARDVGVRRGRIPSNKKIINYNKYIYQKIHKFKWNVKILKFQLIFCEINHFWIH